MLVVKMEEAARSRSTFCGAQLRPAKAYPFVNVSET